MDRDFEIEYSKELDEELRLLLHEYRDGKISVKELLQLIDTTCRDHLDFKIMGSYNGRQWQDKKNSQNEDKSS